MSSEPTRLASAWGLRPEVLAQTLALAFVGGVCAFAFLWRGMNPVQGLIGAAALLALVLATLNPRFSIGLLALSFFIGQGETPVTIVQAVGVLALSTGLVVALARRETVSLGNLAPFFAVWTLWLGCSYFYAPDAIAVTHVIRRFVTNVVIYVLLIHYFGQWRTARRLLFVVYAAVLINAVVAAIQGVQSAGSPIFRARGTSLDPNYLGTLCVVGVGISVIEAWNQPRPLTRALWTGGGVLSLVGMILTASRTASVAILVLGVFLFALFPKRRLSLVVTALLLAALFPLAPESYRGRVEDLTGEIVRSIPMAEKRDLSVRGYLMEAGLRIWRDHPLIGTGAGSFRKYLLSVGYNPGLEWSEGFVVHNAYVGILAESGVIGLLIYGALLLAVCANFWVALRKAPSLEPWKAVTVYEGSLLMLMHLVMTLSLSILNKHSLFLAMALSVILRDLVQRDPDPSQGESTTVP